MPHDEWKIQLHLTCAGELRSMAGKVPGEKGKAELIRMAQDHEQSARSLGENTISDPQALTEAADFQP